MSAGSGSLDTGRKSRLAQGLGLASVILIAVFIIKVMTGPAPAWVATFVTYVLAILFEAIPFIIIGSLISGAVTVFLPADLLPSLVRRMGGASIPATLGLSFVFPTCECGVVAVARSLLRKGLPLSCTVVYLLAAPILNPVVLIATAVAFQFDYRFVIARFIGALFVSVPVALILERIPHEKVFTTEFGRTIAPEHEHTEENEHAEQRSPLAPKFRQLLGHARHELVEMVPFLLMGVVLAAFMQTFLGSRMLSLFARNQTAGTAAMMSTAFTLSLCSEADAFVAKTFAGVFGFTAIMAFLVYGPMLDIKLILMYRTVFKPRFILILSLVVTGGVIVYALALGMLFL